MELWKFDIAGCSNPGDHLPAPDHIAAFHQQRFIMSIGGHETVSMANEQQIAKAFDFPAGIGNDTILRRAHRRALGRLDIDAVIV